MKEVQLNVQMVVYDERYIKYTIRRTTDKQFYIQVMHNLNDMENKMLYRRSIKLKIQIYILNTLSNYINLAHN